ncbi:MAG: hypothetical protein OXI84_00010 [bacterium]|nr:hypothetical protein [bacterium]
MADNAGGVAAIAFVIQVFAWPDATELTLTWLIGLHATMLGCR